MAHRKAGGTAKNLRDSQPKYLGTKLHDGEAAFTGNVIIRQRGTSITAGRNVLIGKDHTLFAAKNGVVKFTNKRKTNFNGKARRVKVVSIVSAK